MRAFACVILGVLFLALPPAEAAGQAGTLTGVVQDQAGGEPVPSVQIFIADLNLGGLTQQNGRFLLQNVPAGTHMVTADRLGYRSQTQTVNVAAGQTVTLNWNIVEQAIQLDEVIVTGTPGGTRRRAIGNSVAQVDAATVTANVAIGTVQELLTARSPGLQYQRMPNNIGTSSNIQIRGVGTFNLGSNPLVYVDGVRIDGSAQGPDLSGSNSGNSGHAFAIDDFNPEDIESIEIIKGPAAATLYGTEASAGVIQIITKKGQEGDAQFELTVTNGQNFAIDPRTQIGTRVSCLTANVPLCPSEADLFEYNMYDESTAYIKEGFFPWPSDNLYKNGYSRNYNLTASGGTAAVRYFISGNLSDDQGTLWYNTDKSYRLRTNLTALLTESVSLDISAGYINGNTRYGEPIFSEGGIWRATKLSWGRCLLRVALEACPRRGGYADFRPDDVAKIQVTRAYERFTGSATLNHSYGDWLTQRLVVGLDRAWETDQGLYPKEVELTPVIGQTIQGRLNRSTPNTNNISLDYAASGQYQLTDGISFTTSVGGQYYTRSREILTTNGREFPSEFSSTINQTSATQMSVNYSLIENKSLGFYVQEEVGFNDRLFLTGAIRFDDNSAFGTDFEAQQYPKVSAAYVISEESFWNVDFVNSLRLRGAWGKAGRQPSALSGLNTYSTFRGISGRTAIGPDSPGDPEIGPEVSTEIELGFDVAVMDDRLSGEFTYFTQRNEDALLSQSVPRSTGFGGSVEKNIGRIDNWGWEATLNARLYQGDAVSFDLALNGDHVMNEIKTLEEGYAGTTSIRVGMPYPSYTTGHKILSADLVSPGVATNVMCDSGIELGAADQESRRAYTLGGSAAPCGDVGNLQLLLGPAFHTYTWTVAPTLNLFSNSLRIFAIAQGMYGRQHEDSLNEWVHNFNGTRKVWLKTDPIWISGCNQACTYDDDTVDGVYDGDFWRLREVGFRYQLPASVIDRVGVGRASLSFSGRNLAVLWRKEDMIAGVPIGDPEIGSTSVTNRGNYWQGPPIASAHMTLRVTF
jgi:TonB-linked SusC/RagA family outer membrane protein